MSAATESKRSHRESPQKGDNVCTVKKTKVDFDMKEFVSPDQPSKCTWTKDADLKKSPHSFIRNKHTDKPLPNILHYIGNTPMVKLNRIPQSMGLKCDLYAKCEFLNPGGSVKDRIGYRMVEDAERMGLLKPGFTIIEPTSGNTGIGLAMAAAVKNYRCIIVMPEKMSDEKVNTLKALGAEIIRTPTEAAFDSPEGLIAVSQKLRKQIPNSIILDQYRNAGNPLAHYDTTAAEILEALDGKVDMVVIGTGTGGTATGIARKIKETCPGCVIVGADPEGSILAEPESLNKTDVSVYEVEGIGYDFVPTVLDRSIVDQWIKQNDLDALPMAKRIIKEEGLLCGGSSGFALAAALKTAANLKKGQKCVVILPDGIRNYMTKFVSDQWMEARNFQAPVNVQNHWWWDVEVSQLNLPKPEAIKSSASIGDALDIMKKRSLDQLPVTDQTEKFTGMATVKLIHNKLMNGFATTKDPVEKVVHKKYYKVHQDAKLGLVSRILDIDSYVVVVKVSDGKESVVGIVTNVDLLHYISHNSGETKNGK